MGRRGRRVIMRRVLQVAAIGYVVVVGVVRPALDVTAAAGGATLQGAGAPGPMIEQFLSPAYPQELVSAKKADRIAWWAYERGMRNVYTAVAPDFRPVKLTHFTADNGVDISDVEISDDGSHVRPWHAAEPGGG